MYKSYLSVAAHRVIVDQMTNELSIIDVFEGIRAQSFPVTIREITFLFYLKKDAEDSGKASYELSCKIADEEFFKTPFEVDFQEVNSTRAILRIEGFVLPQDGELRVEMKSNNDVIGGFSLPVEKLSMGEPVVSSSSSPASQGG